MQVVCVTSSKAAGTQQTVGSSGWKCVNQQLVWGRIKGQITC